VSRRNVLPLACALTALVALAFVLLRSGGAAGDGTDSRTADTQDEPARGTAVQGLPATSAGGEARRDALAPGPGGDPAGAALHGDIAPPDGCRVDLLAHGTGEAVQQMASGAYRFDGLAEGTYTVSAHRAGAFSTAVTVDLDAGEERRVDLRLEPPIELEVFARGEDLPRRKWPRELRVVATPWRPEQGRPVAGLRLPHGNGFGLGSIRWDDESVAVGGERRIGTMSVSTRGAFWVALVRHTTPVATIGPVAAGTDAVTLPWDRATWSTRRNVRVLAGDRRGGEARLVAVDRTYHSADFSGGVAELEDLQPSAYFVEATGAWGLWASSLDLEPGDGPVEIVVPDETPRRVSLTCVDPATGDPISFETPSGAFPSHWFELVPADGSLPYDLASRNVNLRPFGGATTTEFRLLPGRFHVRLSGKDLQSGTALVDTRAGDVQVSLPCAPPTRLLARPPEGLDWSGYEFVVRDGAGRVLQERLLRGAGPVWSSAPPGVVHLEVRAGTRLLAEATVQVEAGGAAPRAVALRPR